MNLLNTLSTVEKKLVQHTTFVELEIVNLIQQIQLMFQVLGYKMSHLKMTRKLILQPFYMVKIHRTISI